MAVRESVVWLVCAVAAAMSLTLDRLPHRSDFSEMQQPFQDKDRFGTYDFVPGTIARKRKAGDEEGLFLKNHDDDDSYFEKLYGPMESFRDQTKREAKSVMEENNEKELSEILKDDEAEEKGKAKDKKIPPDAKRKEAASKKKKRESREGEVPAPKEHHEGNGEQEESGFPDWLRREYYRNMAKSFASMRRKRAMWSGAESERPPIARRSVAPPARASALPRQKKEVRFQDVTDNLKALEDALLSDALQVVEKVGDGHEERRKVKHRVTNDLNAAYDIETMRAALFRLQDTLYNMEEESAADSTEFAVSYKKHKRGEQCPPLNVLTSDCTVLSDIVPDDSLKDLLSRACNWHEVCYSCGEVFGLSSDNCDLGFVEQSRTICRGDVPCESTAKLLLIPLRERRVFYKRSNPSVCLVDPCVEEFLNRAGE